MLQSIPNVLNAPSKLLSSRYKDEEMCLPLRSVRPLRSSHKLRESGKRYASGWPGSGEEEEDGWKLDILWVECMVMMLNGYLCVCSVYAALPHHLIIGNLFTLPHGLCSLSLCELRRHHLIQANLDHPLTSLPTTTYNEARQEQGKATQQYY